MMWIARTWLGVIFRLIPADWMRSVMALVTVSHFVGFSYQLSVQMSAGGVSIGWYRFTLDVFEPTSVGRTFHFSKL